MYEYDGRILKVIDGETLIVEVDLGFHIRIHVKLALAGVKVADIDSKNEDEAKAAVLAREYLRALADGKACRAKVSKTTRGYVALVSVFDVDLSSDMVKAGHARGRA
jgi:endonuclease YncB( thermonuclease family)